LYGILSTVVPLYNYFSPSDYGQDGLPSSFVISGYIFSTTMEWNEHWKEILADRTILDGFILARINIYVYHRACYIYGDKISDVSSHVVLQLMQIPEELTVNKHATLRKDANILSRRWVFGFITNNPILVDPLTAESVSLIISMMNESVIVVIIIVMNGKRFKVRSLIGRFCDISEIFFGKMKLITLMLKCKSSE
jgi:hypothetical protein